MRLMTSFFLVLALVVIPTAACTDSEKAQDPTTNSGSSAKNQGELDVQKKPNVSVEQPKPITNLIRNGDFSNGFEGWDKFHSTNVNDTWNLQIGGPDNYLSWKRGRSRNDGGSVGAVQSMDIDVSGYKKLLLSIDVMVEHHTLLNSGWWSEKQGGSGEYPAKIILFYDDDQGNRHMWTHGFLSTNEKQPVTFRNPDTGTIEQYDGTTSTTNFTMVPKEKWFRYTVDLMAPGQLIDMDLKTRGKQMPKPQKLVMIRLVGQGWDFAAAVDNVTLHGE